MAATKWTLDSTHSELGFKIRHLMISNISGAFTDFQVEMTTKDEDITTAQINVVVKMDSVNTKNAQRDEHLRNADFFEAGKYPEMRFVSTKILKRSNDEFDLYGDLTLKGIIRPVVLNVEYGGVTNDPWGGERAGFMINGKINRTEWGMTFNSVLDTGGLALAEEVKISAEVQMVKQAVGEVVAQ
jgi:polyisoprenoid-binding protein YceI